jgi:hypothetical protein
MIRLIRASIIPGFKDSLWSIITITEIKKN